MLDIVASYQYMQFQGKRMIQTQDNSEKPHFGTDLGWLGGSQKSFFFFFFKNLASSVARYHGQLSSSTISEKTNNPVLSDGQMDRQIDRQTRVIS